LRDWSLAFHGDYKSRSGRARLDPHNLPLSNDLSVPNNRVFTDRHHKTHVTMSRNGCVSLEQYASEAYVVADGSELSNRVSGVECDVDRIAQVEPTITSILRAESPIHMRYIRHVRTHAAIVRVAQQVHRRELPETNSGKTIRSCRQTRRACCNGFCVSWLRLLGC
jgi:hypothetical protein